MRKRRRVQGDGGGGATKEHDVMSRNHPIDILDAEVLDEEYGYMNRKSISANATRVCTSHVLNFD